MTILQILHKLSLPGPTKPGTGLDGLRPDIERIGHDAGYQQALNDVHAAVLADVEPQDHAAVAGDLLREAVAKGMTQCEFIGRMLGSHLTGEAALFDAAGGWREVERDYRPAARTETHGEERVRLVRRAPAQWDRARSPLDLVNAMPAGTVTVLLTDRYDERLAELRGRADRRGQHRWVFSGGPRLLMLGPRHDGRDMLGLEIDRGLVEGDVPVEMLEELQMRLLRPGLQVERVSPPDETLARTRRG